MSESSVCNNIKLEELEKYQNEFYYMLSKWKNLKSNEQKLTLLLILVNILSKLNAVKAVKGDSPEKDLQYVQDLYKSLGTDFFDQLLRPSSSTDLITLQYQEVAISLLAVLSRIPSICEEARLSSHTKVYSKFITLYLENSTEEHLNVCLDVFECLRGILCCSKGSELLIEDEAFLVSLFDTTLDERTLGSSALIVTAILNQFKNLIITKFPSVYADFLAKVVSKFCILRDKNKFIYCDLLTCLVRCLPDEPLYDFLFKMQPDLLPLLQKSLSELFRSKLTAEFRRKCLTLTADLSFLWDLEWLEDGEGHVLASCIAHTCVEIRMIIDDSSVAELEKQEKLLFSCFVILEKALQFFSEGSSASVCSSFAPFVICRTNTSITDAIKSILRMFRDVRILSCVEHAQEDEGLPTVLHACIRMVSVWLVCDPEDLDGDVLETLPSLITLCSSRQSFAKLLLPALCQLTREANYAACFTAHGGHSVIDHYLADHMGDCRETLSVCSGLNVFLNILTAQETAVSTKPEVFTSLVNTLCNARPPDDTCKATAAVVGLLIVRQTSEVDLCSTETNCYADFLRVYASFLASLLLCKSRTDGQEDGEELLCLARLAVQGLRECMEKGEAHRHVLIESKLVHELLRALPPRLDDLQLDSNLHREIVKLLASLRQWPEGNTVLQGYNL